MKRNGRFSDKGTAFSDQGTALVLTVFFILLISALVVALLFSVRVDRTSTQSYYQSARAQELANGALEEILSDLKSEITAGSGTASAFTVNGKQIYVPNSPLASQPARIGFTTGTNGDYATDIDPAKIPPTLVRVSRAGYDINAVYPSASYDQTKVPSQRASSVSTSSTSANGRTISSSRWNTSYLLSGSATPPTTFTSKTPDWIYLTRGGSLYNTGSTTRAVTDADVPNLKPTPNLDKTSTVIGRYAYIVYDAGGLIDVNCAGYPSTLAANTTSGTAEIRGKSSIVYASLTSLPGLTSTQVDNLVNWRSKGSITASGTNGFIGAVTNWLQHGFLLATGTNGSYDNPLLSRKDLIDYFTKEVGSTSALPYLGVFSRSLAAPSTRPITPWNDLNNNGVQDSGESLSIIDYNANADLSGTANRDLANVRFTSDGTVTHYADDATSKTYQVKNGDQLLQSRFSLARLAWLADGDPNTGNGPTGSRATAIKACFGLVWDYPGGAAGAGTMANGGNKCWNYVGSNGSTASFPGTIETLDLVAAEGREPNFFELLKAAILAGSLGKDPGPAAFNNGQPQPPSPNVNANYGYPFGPSSTLMMGPAGKYCYTLGAYNSTVLAPARIPDMQIIKIGANIIDQYDADSYPTAIYFKYQGVGNYDPVSGGSADPTFGPVTMAYGIENLPYLQCIRQVVASPSPTGTPPPSTSDGNTGADLATNTMGGWRQPYLWNPHQPPVQTLSSRPGSYQIRAYGRPCYTEWLWPKNEADAQGKTAYNYSSSTTVQYYKNNDNTELPGAGTINFTMSNPTGTSTFCFYDLPYPLLQDGLSGISATSPYHDNLGNSTMPYYDEAMSSPYSAPNHFVGFTTGICTGTDPQPYYVLSGTNHTVGVSGYGDDGVNTYMMGWIDSSNGFHPYSFLTGVFTYENIKLKNPYRRIGSVNPYECQTCVWTLEDPRSERFSLSRDLWGDFPGSITVYKGNNSGWYPSAGPRTDIGNGFYGQGYMPSQPYSYPIGDLMVNSINDPPNVTPALSGSINYYNTNSTNGYYSDPDGIVRPADGYYGNPATGDGLMTFINNGNPSGSSSLISNDDKTISSHSRRPIILNRPFRSVGELGYVFRDIPFKSLDFFSHMSADTALLDVFCLNDLATVVSNKLSPITAGRINPNAASATVLKAVLSGGAKKDTDATYNLTANDATSVAKTLAAKIMQSGSFAPINGYQNLIPALADAMRVAAAANSPKLSSDMGNKANIEAPIRAIAESTDLRTWNLMVDLIVQSGQISPNGSKLGDFVVQAECRVWMHVSIDRYTGEVVARQIEPIYE